VGSRGSFSSGEADHSHPSNAKVKNAWSCISAPPICLHGVMLFLIAKFVCGHITRMFSIIFAYLQFDLTDGSTAALKEWNMTPS